MDALGVVYKRKKLIGLVLLACLALMYFGVVRIDTSLNVGDSALRFAGFVILAIVDYLLIRSGNGRHKP
jgi:hypothetical protein